jgi:hypothetical protein
MNVVDFNYTIDSLFTHIDIETNVVVEWEESILDALAFEPLMRNLEDNINDFVWEYCGE